MLIAGCAEPPGPTLPALPYTCLLPEEQRMLVAELFFSRSIKGRGPLSDAEWTEFAAQTITPNFPDGFTVFDGEGQWRNPQTGVSPAAGPKSCLSPPSENPISRGG
jgi:hypothetical protein